MFGGADLFSGLPSIVRQKILKYLPLSQWQKCERVSKGWKEAVESDGWKSGSADTIGVTVNDLGPRVIISLEKRLDSSGTSFQQRMQVTFLNSTNVLSKDESLDLFIFWPNGLRKVQSIVQRFMNNADITGVHLSHLPGETNMVNAWFLQWISNNVLGSLVETVTQPLRGKILEHVAVTGAFNSLVKTYVFLVQHAGEFTSININLLNRYQQEVDYVHVFHQDPLPALQLHHMDRVIAMVLRMPCGLTSEDMVQRQASAVVLLPRNKPLLNRISVSGLGTLSEKDLELLFSNTSGQVTVVHMGISPAAVGKIYQFFKNPGEAKNLLSNVTQLAISHEPDVTRFQHITTKAPNQALFYFLPVFFDVLPKLTWLNIWKYAGYREGPHRVENGEDLVIGVEAIFRQQLEIEGNREKRGGAILVTFHKSNVATKAPWVAMLRDLRNDGFVVETKELDGVAGRDRRLAFSREESRDQNLKLVEVRKGQESALLVIPTTFMHSHKVDFGEAGPGDYPGEQPNAQNIAGAAAMTPRRVSAEYVWELAVSDGETEDDDESDMEDGGSGNNSDEEKTMELEASEEKSGEDSGDNSGDNVGGGNVTGDEFGDGFGDGGGSSEEELGRIFWLE